MIKRESYLFAQLFDFVLGDGFVLIELVDVAFKGGDVVRSKCEIFTH
jgi:hypothetical protein